MFSGYMTIVTKETNCSWCGKYGKHQAMLPNKDTLKWIKWKRTRMAYLCAVCKGIFMNIALTIAGKSLFDPVSEE